MSNNTWVKVVLLLLLAGVVSTTAFAGGHPVGLIVHNDPVALEAVEFEDADGGSLTLEDFRGRVLLINVWATWCPPCREEMPTLDRLQAELGGDRFEVLALSIDRDGVEAVRRFFESIGIESLAIYVDTSARISESLRVVGLPTTVLVDAEGREVARAIGPYAWDSPEIVDTLKGFIDEPTGG